MIHAHKSLRFARVLLASASIVAAAAISLPARAQNAPNERTRTTLDRTAASPLKLSGELSKNIFRKETRQVPYDVEVPYQTTETYAEQVPYEDTETYTEQVPYQETESYDVSVPYQETETYVEQVPYTERIPYTDTETYYEREQRCQDVTRSERVCRNEPVCHSEPTSERQCSVERICRTDHTGREVCIDKEVCRQVGGSRQVCHDNQVCRDIPHTERQCDWISVPRTRTVTKYREETRYRSETRTRSVTKYRTETRTRTVTKYRSETRTRTVTKYRPETRTRTVTKYRTEQRCCRPEVFDVFDHQMKLAVELNFPAGSELIAQETEAIDLILKGTETAPEVDVKVRSRIFAYEIVNPRTTAGLFAADLKLVPKFTATELGKGTVMNLKMLPSANSTTQKVIFVDTGIRPRVTTQYQVTIAELTSGTVVHQATTTSNGNEKVEIDVPVNLSKTLDYVIKLDVARSGINLASLVQFSEEAKHEFGRLSPDEVGAKTVSSLVVTDAGDKFLARFKDVGTNENIETVYRVSVMNLETNQPVFSADFKASEVTSEKNVVTLAIPKAGLSEDADHKVNVRIHREGAVLTAPVVFAIEASIGARTTDAFRDQSRVVIDHVLGSGEMAVLSLIDNTPGTSDVRTRYDIELFNSQSRSLGRAMLAREGLTQLNDGTLMVQLSMIAVSRSDLRKFAASGATLTISVRVTRDGAKLGHVEFTRKATLKVP